MTSIICPYCGKVNLEFGWKDYSGTRQCEVCGKIFNISIRNMMVTEVSKREATINLPLFINPEVRAGFSEAVSCFNASQPAYKACVIMCRRALESLAIDMKAKGSKLHEKIQSLYDSKLIPETTFHLASGIRQFGNYGAHPTNDLLKGVGYDEAEIILKITERLIREVYTPKSK